MRLPWTVNFPNPSKRATGRKTTHAELLEFHQDHVYTFEEIEAAVKPWIDQEAATAGKAAKRQRQACKAGRKLSLSRSLVSGVLRPQR